MSESCARSILKSDTLALPGAVIIISADLLPTEIAVGGLCVTLAEYGAVISAASAVAVCRGVFPAAGVKGGVV